tara:strand:+ start:873 stop:1295 length:423 start_codon:yes stop_codon:yes gene_type:complete
MISFFKNNDNVNDNESFSKIAALLIHTAKIDESYSEDEKIIIKKTLLELGAKDSNIDKIMTAATTIEENSNQILDFTREIKNAPQSDKVKIIESLWKIIYSNNDNDMYEANLMRRLAGLLYIDPKTMAHLKEKVKKELME